MVSWQQNPVLFMTWFNTITLNELMRGPVLITVYRYVLCRSVSPHERFKNKKANKHKNKVSIPLSPGPIQGTGTWSNSPCMGLYLLVDLPVREYPIYHTVVSQAYAWLWGTQWVSMISTNAKERVPWDRHVCLLLWPQGEEHSFQFLRTALLLLKCYSYW